MLMEALSMMNCNTTSDLHYSYFEEKKLIAFKQTQNYLNATIYHL